MVYGRNLPWKTTLRIPEGRVRVRTSGLLRLPRARCHFSSPSTDSARVSIGWSSPSLALGRNSSFPATAIATTTTGTAQALGFGGHRKLSVSALRLKEKPPSKDRGGKEVTDEEVDEKAKREEKKDERVNVKVDNDNAGSGDGASSLGEILKGGSGGAGGRGNGSNDSASPGSSGGRRRGASDRALSKPTIPDIYPQVMALPIAKRPLFPGFYKAVTVKDPAVSAAIQEMMKRGQPYIGAFLFKDENADRDTIESVDEVHEVGVFAQITSAFPVHGEDGSLTAVLYPHRRIKISNLLPQGKSAPKIEEPEPIEEIEEEEEGKEQEDKGDVVASFEEEVEKQPAPNPYATSFLKKHNVSIVDVENLVEESYDKKSPVIRAVTSEIVNVFKEVANLNPLFRDQISTFSMSQSAGNVIDEPAKLADFAAAVSAGEVKELQEVLETLGVEERLQKALVVLKKELMNAQLQSKISKDVEAKIQKRQREYWLMEQMKGIRRELGIESDGKDKLVEKFKEKAEKLAMPEAVKKVFDEVLITHYSNPFENGSLTFVGLGT